MQFKEQLHAQWFENVVARNVLVSFVTQCQEDYDLFLSEIREKLGIPVNCMLADVGKSRRRSVVGPNHDPTGVLAAAHGGPEPHGQSGGAGGVSGGRSSCAVQLHYLPLRDDGERQLVDAADDEHGGSRVGVGG